MDLNNNHPFLTFKRYIVLCLSALMLSLSLFMSVLAPLPIAIVMLFYGGKKSLTLVVGGVILFYCLGAFFTKDFSAVIVFAFMSFMALLLAVTAKKKINPSEHIVKVSIILFAIVMGAYTFWLSSQNMPALEFLEKEVVIPNATEIMKQIDNIVAPASAGRQDVVSLLSNTKYLTKEIFTNIPFVVFSFFTIILWINGYLLFKAKRLIMGLGDGAFSEFDFLSYKVPDVFIWIVLVSLVATLWGTDLGYPNGSLFGTMTLKCLGVLYFLHGIGVLIQVLSLLKIQGFFRMMIVALVVTAANWLLAVIGLFDTWFDFRRKIFLGLQNKNK